jgi:hypothetical protein
LLASHIIVWLDLFLLRLLKLSLLFELMVVAGRGGHRDAEECGEWACKGVCRWRWFGGAVETQLASCINVP